MFIAFLALLLFLLAVSVNLCEIFNLANVVDRVDWNSLPLLETIIELPIKPKMSITHSVIFFSDSFFA